MSTPANDWWEVADDPDPERDLDYALIDLDVIQTTTNGRDQVLVLPTDEDLLREDAFMVAEESAVRDLVEMV